MMKTKKLMRNHWEIIALLSFLTVYYLYQMITNYPWYDELYTYFYFISRGPFYAAIHWPLPNNHIGYSVLSALLNFLGSAVISLRGIAYLSALANVVLINKLISRYMCRTVALLGTLLYVCALEINSLSVQGRGYTSSITCYLVALLCCSLILESTGKVIKRYYVLFMLSLTLGLYILPSSVYWVMPVCITGGICLLIQKKYKVLRNLILASLAAAVCTLGLYTIIWLAVGANLISKDESSIYYGVYQITIALKEPLQAFTTGMHSMTSNPYIASIDRNSVIRGMVEYLTYDTFSSYYFNLKFIIMALVPINVCFVFVSLIRNKEKKFFPHIFVIVSSIMMPLMLIIQSVLPYTRVMSFFMVTIAVSVSLVSNIILDLIKNKCSTPETKHNGLFQAVVMFLVLILCMGVLISPLRNKKYAQEESRAYQLLEDSQVFKNGGIENCFYTDDYVRYVLKYSYNSTPEEKPLMEAQYIFMRKSLLEHLGEPLHWPILTVITEEQLEMINEEYEIINENDSYILYKKKIK